MSSSCLDLSNDTLKSEIRRVDAQLELILDYIRNIRIWRIYPAYISGVYDADVYIQASLSNDNK